jgi:hypothetical protein
MSYKLVAIFESGPTCEVTDPAIRGAVARWFEALAAAAAGSGFEAPPKRGPGRPPKGSTEKAAPTNGAEEQQVAAPQS